LRLPNECCVFSALLQVGGKLVRDSRRGFYFMIRRWLLASLFAVTLVALVPSLRAADPAATTSDDALRREIFESSAWRRAMFEVNEWLLTQRVYPPEQVEEMRAQFRQRVDEMSGADLKLLLGDLETKLAIMDSPQAREAKAWMGEYVAVLAERRRAEVLRDLPNLATLTSTQLHDELVRIKQKRDRLDSRQRSAGRNQNQRVGAATQSQQQTQRQLNQARANRPAAFSPYRSQSNVNDRLNTQSGNPRPAFFVDPLGGVGRTLPGGW
jgi:hypothetical protein